MLQERQKGRAEMGLTGVRKEKGLRNTWEKYVFLKYLGVPCLEDSSLVLGTVIGCSSSPSTFSSSSSPSSSSSSYSSSLWRNGMGRGKEGGRDGRKSWMGRRREEEERNRTDMVKTNSRQEKTEKSSTMQTETCPFQEKGFYCKSNFNLPG